MRATRTSIAAATLVAAFFVAACTPPPADPPPSDTDHVVEISPAGVSPATLEVEPGDTIKVIGSGFTETGNLGTRPPLMGQPGGVYVVFGRFGSPWKPSEGAGSSARQVIEQLWAMPTSSYNALGGLEGLVEMDGNGGFEVVVTATEAAGTNPQYGIAVYPGSGASNPAEELLAPVSFAAAAS